MIDVAKIDYWAVSGSGPFHRSSLLAKMVFLLFVFAAALIAKNPLPLALGYVSLLLVSAIARLPWFRMLLLSLYAAIFTVLYLISLRGGILAHVVLIVKAVTPALAVLMLITSTPYPRIFSLLSTVLPEVLAAGLFMTYRTLFILLEMMNDFITAIRLRGGFSPGSLYKNGVNISKGIGMLLVRAVERSSRLYAVMAVRGYSGSMAETGSLKMHRDDWLPLSAGVVVLLLMVFWK